MRHPRDIVSPAGLFVVFMIVHVVMVLMTGFVNNLRSMITGWYGVNRGAA